MGEGSSAMRCAVRGAGDEAGSVDEVDEVGMRVERRCGEVTTQSPVNMVGS